ncbi:hypothetical protein AVEN_270723-1 [Araneus ventricosus]|uniref:DUF19 domain-containing protein n=1 Tax=Araneus ventricosus TaxID=182803 RepID=A0A4Y2JM77_ARAVE|nr:hypothetical protein AVEN_270723-1 [Araneus ventricosus]
MWAFALVALGLMNGVLSLGLICEKKVDKACRLSSVLEKSLPGTVEKLEEECLNLQKLRKCMIDTLGECDGAEYDENSIMEGGLSKDTLRLLKLTTEICKKDSDLHSRFVQDMPCFKKVSDAINEDQDCDDFGILRASLTNTDDGSVHSDIYECQRVLSDMNCFLSRFFDQCGRRAKDTAVEIIQKGGSLDDQCPKDVRRNVLHLFNIWEKQTGKQVHVHELFS